MSRAAQRDARKVAHHAAKARKARTPLGKAGVAFDEWRHLVSQLPAEFADQLGEQMTTHIRAEIARLRPARGGDGQ